MKNKKKKQLHTTKEKEPKTTQNTHIEKDQQHQKNKKPEKETQNETRTSTQEENNNTCEEKKDTTKENDITKLKEENRVLNDKLLRATADIQNMKRRSVEERVTARFDGAKDLLSSIAKTIDDLHRAFAHIPEELQDNDFIKSLLLINDNLTKTLKEQGVEFFGEANEIFDANLHDSMMMDPNTKKNTIAQVFEKGILFKGKVVRHAKVSVGNKE